MVCKNIENAEILSQRFACEYIKMCCSTDIYGVEYAAIMKNIYAISVGISVGLGFGDNFISVLIANGAIETQRFLDNTYPSPRHTSSSPYLGDLLVTTYSQFSRNRTFGMMLGKGYSVKTAQMEMRMIAEGYYSAYCIRQVNKRFGVELPIAEAVYKILYENAPAAETINNLTTKLI
jgi:glycerol-3-phosphate dehydrogenase (NAD(P)+)